MTRIALIGAGSVEFTRILLADLSDFPELAEATVVLHDIDSERLRTAERMVAATIRSAVLSRSESMSCSTTVASASSGKSLRSASRIRVNSPLPAPINAILVMIVIVLFRRYLCKSVQIMAGDATAVQHGRERGATQAAVGTMAAW